MNIEQLNKSQIVLLTLLVSFVTSIATGIVTVSLMDQAPPVVAQTVNRIVERTVETVVPASQTAATTGMQSTVVVKETELISQAVAKVTPSVIRLFENTSQEAPFLGLGIVVHSNGTIVTDASLFATSNEAAVGLSDGTRVKVVLSSKNDTTGIAFLQATSSEGTVAWKPAAVKASTPVLGQTVVMLSGRSVARVESGIASAIVPMKEGATGELMIDTNITPETIIPGSPLINTSGEILGVSTGAARASSTKGFAASTAFLSDAGSGGSGGSTQ